MPGIDDMHAKFNRLLGFMIFHIPGHIGIRAHEGRLLDELRAAAAAERDLAHRPLTSVHQTNMLRRQCFTYLPGEVVNCHGCRQASHASHALHRSIRRLADNHKGRQFRQTDRLSQYIIDSANGNIQIRMGRRDRDIMLQKLLQTMPQWQVCTDFLQAPEDQRMMGHDHISLGLNGLFHHMVTDIQTNHYLPYILIQGPDQQSRIIPFLSQTLRCNTLQCIHNDLTTYHFSRSSNSMTCFFTC